MAAMVLRLFTAMLSFCIFKQGAALNCPESDNQLNVTYTQTDTKIEGQEEYEMTFINVCMCSLHSVVLSCPPFNYAKGPDPMVISHLDESTCTFHDGQYVYTQDSIKFKYAGPQPDKFVVRCFNVACS
ncbi:hypothetical protein AMTRI_Chr06g191860 [Amborella trichopoda]